MNIIMKIYSVNEYFKGGEYMTIYKIRGRRNELGKSQKDVAKELGITPQYLCKIEKGLVEPRRDLMERIATLLDADVKDLFFND